ncbi:MAG: hypothetical protein WKF37_12130 [Bryobacteraceae bacterium]
MEAASGRRHQSTRTSAEERSEKKELDAFETELLGRLRQGKAAKALGKSSKADLRLELKRQPPRIFSVEERQKHARLLEEADRTGDLAEQTALDRFEKPALEQLKAAYNSGKFDPAERFESLTIADVQAEAVAKYSGKSIFSVEEKNRHAELTSQVDILRRRMDRWKPNVMG